MQINDYLFFRINVVYLYWVTLHCYITNLFLALWWLIADHHRPTCLTLICCFFCYVFFVFVFKESAWVLFVFVIITLPHFNDSFHEGIQEGE